MFSSGVGSWAAAKLVAQKYGTTQLILLFADTKIEDEDNYRFLYESAINVGGELQIVCEGRTPFDVFKDEKFLNHRVSNCSKKLKIEPCRKFIEQFTHDECILYVGIDWEEFERAEKIKTGWLPYKVEFPLCGGDKWLSKVDIFDWLHAEKLIPPRLYSLGFAHANCGGFCVKAGKSQFKNLLKHFPLRYKKAEEEEEEFRQIPTCGNTTILRETIVGEKK
jgi:3'-phosphoadenosine 5'-phosphosulfate sulfotransferase (PAPS reductase)/FAD synthetase